MLTLLNNDKHSNLNKLIYIALPTCNVESLILPVLNRLIKNTFHPYILSICDNASKDNTYTLIKDWAQNLSVSTYNNNPQRIYLSRLLTRRTSCEVINQSLSRVFHHSDVSMVAKLDHDYGVPSDWDKLIHPLLDTGEYSLLSPSVSKDTPKGMQYFSQNIAPELVTSINYEDIKSDIYHYTGIAGYCHCFTPEKLKELGGYRPLTKGAVFGSEDADWSLRSGTLSTKGYLMCLEGHHWTKPGIGVYEDKWKAAATFGHTFENWESWAEKNVPK